MRRAACWLKNERFWLFLILLVGAILRFWKIGEWQYFTYDQARDYIIIKRIILNGKFTLVGPTVSIAPGFYLPPFYYYSLTLFLILSKFHLVGPDIYTAIFGTASIFLFYTLAKRFFGSLPALVSTFAFSLNPYLIHSSRHAWNPNTIIFYILLFILAFSKCVLEKKRKYLILASFALFWAIGLHLTAVVFVPLLGYLFYLELKNHGFGKISMVSLFPFLFIFTPLVLFDIRHGFPIFNATINFLKSQKEAPLYLILFKRFQFLLVDLIKVPTVLLSGLFQSENLTIRPSNITNFGKVEFLQTSSVLKLIFTLAVLLMIFLSVLSHYGVNKKKEVNIVLIFLMLGILIRLLFPPAYFFFYYYLSIFPIIFLLLSWTLFWMLKKNIVHGKIFVGVVISLSILSLFPNGLKAEVKAENYFLPACEIIAKDFSPPQKIAIANNLYDTSRWEHNGLEYRYFLEALYKLSLGNWDASDYKSADVLYLIDEGNLKEPLRFGGMEMEAFRPKKIEKVWQVATGQKIYKMTHD